MHRMTAARVAVAALAATLAACGSSGTPTSTTSAGIALTLSPASATVQQGGSTQVTGTLTRTDFTGAVQLTVLNAPAGVTGSLTTPPGAGNSGVATIAVSAERRMSITSRPS